MTRQEKIEAYKKYTTKLKLLGNNEEVSTIFKVTGNEITIYLDEFARFMGYPRKLRIPDFVDKIDCKLMP